ncbi:MAG TPA: DUF1736 domain-containing protein, partial [Saprospiraceae bacterium]|nr:DUF1736 domain-containing protein [Saprospiraceae bacterium]
YREGCFGGCLYRPLTLTAFAVEWAIAPNSPAISHWMNVLWYTATAVLLYSTLRLLLHGRSAALPLVAALLFVAHPVHTEVVANIKSRDEIMSLFFGLLSLHFFCRSLAGRGSTAALRTGAAIAYGCALLSKEGAITMLPVFPLVAWTFYGRSLGGSLQAALWALAPVGVFFLLRGAALSGLTSPPVSYLDNPIVAAKTGGERLLTSMLVLLKYLGLLLLPLTLLSDYSYNAFPLAQPGDVWAMLSGLLHLGLLSWALWQLPRRNALAFCVLAYLAGISLYSQLPAVIGTLLGERLLYLPSLWGCVGIALLLARLLGVADPAAGTAAAGWGVFSPKEKMLLAAVAGVSLFFAFQTLRRNGDWANNLALFGADVAKAPNSVRLNDGYAEELYRSLTATQDLPEAEKERILALSEQHSRRSLSMEPASLSANINIGNLRFFKRQYAEAAAAYEKCLSIKADYSFARRNLAAVLIEWAREEGEKKNNPDKARELLLRSLAIDDKNATAW